MSDNKLSVRYDEWLTKDELDLIYNAGQFFLYAAEEDLREFCPEEDFLPEIPEHVRREIIIDIIYSSPAYTVKFMLSKNLPLSFVSGEGYSPLHAAIDADYPEKYEIMETLIKKGADVNIGATRETMAINSWTPLHMAMAREDKKATDILLKHGADPTIRTIIDDYSTPAETAEILSKIKNS